MYKWFLEMLEKQFLAFCLVRCSSLRVDKQFHSRSSKDKIYMCIFLFSFIVYAVDNVENKNNTDEIVVFYDCTCG